MDAFRGHMAAAANHNSTQKHMDDTFYFSNMAPQVGRKEKKRRT